MRRVPIMILAVLIIALPFAAVADDGPAIYKSKCAMCHGPDGAGQTPAGKSMKARDLRSDDVQKAKDEDLEKIIANGKGKMPAYKGKLTEAEIDSLVKYIRELGKKK